MNMLLLQAASLTSALLSVASVSAAAFPIAYASVVDP